MSFIETSATRLLVRMLGPAAAFRDGQLEAILATVEERARTLVVQRTGWGKSLVYFIATRLLRDQGMGPTLLVSPLLSLMRNQIEAAERIGIRAVKIDSDTPPDIIEEIEQALIADAVDVLLVSPERLANERFLAGTVPLIRRGIGLLVVDEAHCISDWGHDFRPDYRRIVRITRSLPPNVPLLGTTATANDRVIADVQAQLGVGLRVSRGPLTRETLRLQAIELHDQAERLAWLAAHVPRLPGSGIVYCLTTRDCEQVSAWLQQHGIDAAAYHAQLPEDVSRAALEQRLLNNEVKALVATVALGMGFDKPDLGFVVHYQRPGSLIAYYQQIGRAGRAVPEAFAILLSGREDDEIQEYFINAAFPEPQVMQSVLEALEAEETLTLQQLQATVNLPKRRLEQCLRLLEVDGAVARNGGRYFRTPNPWAPDVERAARVTATRWQELRAMKEFVGTRTCLMEFIARSLDDPHARPCRRCAACQGPIFPATVKESDVERAVHFLRRSYRRIDPRKQWPSFAVSGRRGQIRREARAENGYALSVWGDAGWGRLVVDGKRAGRFDDRLVKASAEMIATHWRPGPPPAWVTAVPSRRHPDLVPDFARRLAAALGLPFVASLEKARATAEQKTMENSAQQLTNVADAFVARAASVRPDPVLLVDDMVDSRWTFTECAYVLRTAGSGLVYPLALAVTSLGGGA